MSKEIIHKIIPNIEIEVPLSLRYIDKIELYQKEVGKWYLKSFDSLEGEKLVYNEKSGKRAPEEIVRQLFVYELIHEYGYPKERIKIEQSVSFGREIKRADVIVYQNDNQTPLILAEIKAPHEKNSPQQLKSYLNAEGSPIGVGYNGKNISRYIRPYPKEFDTIRDLPFEHEYQTAKDEDLLIQKLKELIANRKWTLTELNELNKIKSFDLKAIVEELEELVLANSGVDSFDEIFKLIYTKLYDEFEAENRPNETLLFRDYSNAEITHKKIAELFDEAKDEWRDVFEPTDKIKLTPEHLEIVIGKLTEVKLYGANLRIIDEAFEYLVPDVSKGKKGQYFTPRVVIDACVKMLNPKRKDYIIDPACGSAGFLLHAMEYVWQKYSMKTYRKRSDYAGKYLWGIDFEERTTKISRALMLIAGDGKTHIYKQNTLEYKKWTEAFKSDLKKENLLSDDIPQSLKYNVVMSNPPFAGDIKEKTIINLYKNILGLRYSYKIDYTNLKSMLKSFSEEFNIEFSDSTLTTLKDFLKKVNKDETLDLENQDDVDKVVLDFMEILNNEIQNGSVEEDLLKLRIAELIKFKKNNTKWSKVGRHILFIQRIYELLDYGGRCVIVLPQGVFNNSSMKYIRRYIFEKFRVLGIIGLHGNSFKPHTGTKTSVILLRKFTEKELKSNKPNSNYPIFFATSRLSFKNKSGNYLYLKDDNGQAILDSSNNPLYRTDINNIAKMFIKWGIEQLKGGDKDFEFLDDLDTPKIDNVVFSEIMKDDLPVSLRFDAEFWQKEILESINKIKESNYIRLGDYINVTNGFPWKSKFFIEEEDMGDVEGEPFIRIRDCKPQFIDNDRLTQLEKEYADSINFPKAIKNDIVIGMDGLKWFYGSLVVEPAYVNQRVCHIRLKDNCPVPAEYVVFIINSKIGQMQLLKQMTIADTVGHITNKDVENLLIPIFDTSTRNKIVEKVKSSIIQTIEARKKLKESSDLLENKFVV